MRKHNGLADTKNLPPIPKQPPQSGAQPHNRRSAPSPAPHTAIRRASMNGTVQSGEKQMPYRRPPQEQPQRRKTSGDRVQPNLPRKRTKKRRKNPRRSVNWFGRILITLTVAVLLCFVGYSALSISAIRRMQYQATGSRALTSGVAQEDAKVRNILLIGTDSRGNERGRADSIILLSISKHNKTITMTSLLRDSYVSIPDHGTDKLNAAYAYGGATLLMDTVANNFGIPVDDYICIGFTAFVHIADALGGVEITLSDREAQAVNEILHNEVNGIMGDPADADYLSGGGTYVLNGKQALSYSRIRYVGNADFERTERQRTVLTALLQKALHPSFGAIPDILQNALPEITTNISNLSLYWMSLELPAKLLSYELQTLRLPADGTFSDQTAPNGQQVLAVDFDANLQLYLDAVQQPAAAGE